jgi:cytochrome c5
MMIFKRIILGGCLIGASFFVACQSNAEEPSSEANQAQTSEAESDANQEDEKSLEVNEPSELALLMRSMYDKNLALKQDIKAGKIPESFPEDFLNIHTAQANENLNETFDALAKEYIANMEAITQAKTTEEGVKAYNAMVNTCASCHTIYCQGPLAKIRRMKIKDFESEL